MSFLFGDERNIVHEIALADTFWEKYHLWAMHMDELDRCRLILSSDDDGKSQIPHIYNYIKERCGDGLFLLSYFKGEKKFILDNRIVQTMLGGSEAQMMIVSEILIDSNIASEMSRVVEGKIAIDSKSAKQLIDIVNYMKRYGVPLNAMPYLVENISKDCGNYFFDTLKNFFIFSDTDFSQIDKGKVRFDRNNSSAEEKTQKLMTFDPRKSQTHHQFLVSYLCFGWAIYIELTSKKDFQHKINEYISGIMQILKKVPLHEFVEVSKFLYSRKLCRQLNVVNRPFVKNKDYVAAIRNLSWDFAMIRMLGTVATYDIEGVFHFPFFLTRDKKLAELVYEQSVKQLFISKTNSESFSFTDQMRSDSGKEYLEILYSVLGKYFTEDSLEERGRHAWLNYDELQFYIEHMEQLIRRLTTA